MFMCIVGGLGAVEEEDGGKTAIDPDHELHTQLHAPLRDCSRQRLRSIQMSLRKYANVESRITSKELQQVFTVSLDYLDVSNYELYIRLIKNYLIPLF